ncbi:cadmium resistance transporter [Streptomyces sp. NRRL B-1140]|uniref:cadmium resistance transporter n=1 Tax=Streptomyces sp. NRRL B-1140 TaxID=1415549 RepID=UPI000AE6744E
MNLGIVGQAAGLFAVTNIDDILILSLFFAQGAGHHGSARRIVIGQYLGFAAILAVALAVAAAFGATFLPESAIPYLGLLTLALGFKAAWQVWQHRDDEDDEPESTEGGPKALEVAAVTFANGGDNIGVYVPVFATAGIGGMTVYTIVFLVLVAVWCFAGRFFATRSIAPAVRSSRGGWPGPLSCSPCSLQGVPAMACVRRSQRPRSGRNVRSQGTHGRPTTSTPPPPPTTAHAGRTGTRRTPCARVVGPEYPRALVEEDIRLLKPAQTRALDASPLHLSPPRPASGAR